MGCSELPQSLGFVLGVCLRIGLDQGLDHLSGGWSRLGPRRFEDLVHWFKGWTTGRGCQGTPRGDVSRISLCSLFSSTLILHLDPQDYILKFFKLKTNVPPWLGFFFVLEEKETYCLK